MAITSTTFTTLATSIAAVIDAATTLSIVYTYEPRDLDQLPAACVLGPEGERRLPDDPEPQMGSVGLHSRWIVRLWVSADNPAVNVPQLRQAMGEVIGLIDADNTISNLDVVVANFRALPDPFDSRGTDRSFYQAELELHVFSLH